VIPSPGTEKRKPFLPNLLAGEAWPLRLPLRVRHFGGMSGYSVARLMH
jgi:hypothetical protein